MAQSKRSVTIKSDTPIPSAGSLEVSTLTNYIEQMQRVVPLKSLKVKRIANTLVYNYDIEAIDGREWHQTITFTSLSADSNPAMTFDVQDGWRNTEFSLQRAIRDGIVRLIDLYQLDTLDYDID